MNPAMKKTAFLLAAGALFLSSGCNTVETWDDGLPEMEHVYYIGFQKTNISRDKLDYTVTQDGTSTWRYEKGAWQPAEKPFVASIPFQFHSERIRPYDAVINFWVVNAGTSDLVAGTDYSISLEGTALTPDNGIYSFAWPQAKKGVRNVEIKRLTSKNGTLKVYVLDPAKGTPDPNKYETTTVNNKTSEYEVRAFSFDYGKVTITFTN
jgi:hypothetical protein